MIRALDFFTLLRYSAAHFCARRVSYENKQIVHKTH